MSGKISLNIENLWFSVFSPSIIVMAIVCIYRGRVVEWMNESTMTMDYIFFVPNDYYFFFTIEMNAFRIYISLAHCLRVHILCVYTMIFTFTWHKVFVLFENSIVRQNTLYNVPYVKGYIRYVCNKWIWMVKYLLYLHIQNISRKSDEH